MTLSVYHQKYLDRTDKDIEERIVGKEFELKQIFQATNYIPPCPQIKIAVLGCGVKYFVEAHRSIFNKLLNVDVDLITFDITIEHLQGEKGIIQHDCTLPLPDGPFDMVYSSVLLKFIKTEKQWDILLNSYNALVAGGLAIHLLGNEEDNAIDVKLGYNNVPLSQLRNKIKKSGFDLKEINIMTGPDLNHKELVWVLTSCKY